jgi:two-component system phosphate regulon sensor histidine kinase PhoR
VTKKILAKILGFGVAVTAITALLVVAIFYTYSDVKLNGQMFSHSSQVEHFSRILIYVAVGIIVIIALSVMISIAITKSIVKPIEELKDNLDNLDNVKTYKELQPFVDALKAEKENRKILDKQKKQFTANVSHELKTPLTSIAGYAELIETGIAKEPDIKPFATIIRKQALRLVTLSEDIIQLSQLDESDEEEITFSSVDIYETANRCVQALSINAKAKGIDIALTGESTFIKANPSLLEELIYNLCDNAIRYNKENGKVEIKIYTDASGTTLSVSDTGIGIEDKYKDRIFERFFRVDKSRSKATGGTGLGLAIVKHIAQIHGAEISVDSKLNEGTTIYVHFVK